MQWSRRAAQLAVGRYEIDDGLTLLHQAVTLESQPDRQAELWQEIGHANALRFDGDAFRAAMEKAIELGGPSASSTPSWRCRPRDDPECGSRPRTESSSTDGSIGHSS